MKQNGLLLAPHTAERPGRVHDGKVIMIHSNLRWCSDGLEFTCWNGEVVRMAFAIDAHDREIIAWHAVAGGGISGDMVRDMMLEAVEIRFGTLRAPHPIDWLSDNGSPNTAKPTRTFAQAIVFAGNDFLAFVVTLVGNNIELVDAECDTCLIGHV